MVCPTHTPKDADVISTVVGNVEDFGCGMIAAATRSQAYQAWLQRDTVPHCTCTIQYGAAQVSKLTSSKPNELQPVAASDRILCCVTSWSWTMREKVFPLHQVGRSGLQLQDHARPIVYSMPNPLSKQCRSSNPQSLSKFIFEPEHDFQKVFLHTRVHFQISDEHARV